LKPLINWPRTSDLASPLLRSNLMHLNQYAEDLNPLDLTLTAEFKSLCASAADLGITHSPQIRYTSNNTVLRHHRFHSLKWGEVNATPVLFLHGSNQSAHSFDLVSLHLADRFCIYALDQRGHGDSEWAKDSDYSSEAMGLDAASFINTMNLDHMVVVGHSMGGQNAMRLALAHPDRVAKLVLIDVGPEMAEVGRRTIRSFVTSTREFDDIDHFVARVQEYDPYRTREHIERTVRYNLIQRADGKFISKHDHGPRLKATGEHRRKGDQFTLEDVAGLSMPTLIIRGADSTIFTAEAASRFVNAVPDSRLVTIDSASHNVHSQNTPDFIEALVSFIG